MMWTKKYAECKKCGLIKNRHASKGLCVSCYANWRYHNLPSYKASQKKWRDKNKDKIKQYNERNWERNKEAILRSHKNWIERNKEYVRERHARYHRERYRKSATFRAYVKQKGKEYYERKKARNK